MTFQIEGTQPVDGQPRHVIGIIEAADKEAAIAHVYKEVKGFCLHKATELEEWLRGGSYLMVS